MADALREGKARGGFAAAASCAAEVLIERSRDMYVKPEMISFFFDWAGEIDRAMEWIEEGYELRDHQIAYSAVSPYSDALRRRLEVPGHHTAHRAARCEWPHVAPQRFTV